MILIRGLPGSGKSFLANKLYQETDGIVLSTDDIVTDRNGTYLYSPDYLGLAHKLNQLKTKEACKQGINVIIDNTNTTWKEIKSYVDIAKEYGYLIELKVPDTSWAFNVEECYQKNSHKVPKDVIQNMAKRFQSNEHILKCIRDNTQIIEEDETVVSNPHLPSCVICDLDGTLAILNRGPYDTAKCEKDSVCLPVKQILNDIDPKYYVFLMSGREDKFRPHTERWLKQHNIRYDELFMRKTGDFRRDSIIKKELFNDNIRDKYNTFFVVDDRLQVIRECWNRLGVFVLNVNQKLEEF